MSPRWVAVRQRTTGQLLLSRVRWGSSFLSRLRGLMFQPDLKPDEALLLVEARDTRAAASIHMFFMRFPIAAIWINGSGRVVDKTLALPWRPYYAPCEPARYTLEAHPSVLSQVTVGEQVEFLPILEA